MDVLRAAPAARAAIDRWEVGSDFHWDLTDFRDRSGGTWLPSHHELFSSFTGALRSLVEMLPGRPAVHLPSYFWMGMVPLLEPVVTVRYYREIPDGTGPDLDSVRAEPGDVVLAVNLFGRADRRHWSGWARDQGSVIMVEDHTHDPISPWAASSTADYCIASLRKTVPVPDGAPIWSPAGHALPKPSADESVAANRKFNAMMLKAAWLSGKGVDKADFRVLQTTGEQALSAGTFSPTAYTRSALAELDVRRLRAARIANVERLLAGLPPRDPFAPLTHLGPDTAPFNVQLLCASEPIRDDLRRHLAQRRVYAPVHWPHPPGDPRAVDIGSRILTVPADHRYTRHDVDRVLEILADFKL